MILRYQRVDAEENHTKYKISVENDGENIANMEIDTLEYRNKKM